MHKFTYWWTWFADRPWTIVALVTLLGASLRIYNLGLKSLWLDEVKVFWIAQGTLGDVIAHNAAENSAPPLYVILINLVSKIDLSEAVLRSLSCVTGILSVPAMMLLARQYTGRIGAYLSSLFVAVSANMVDLSQELREYSLTFFFAILTLYSFRRFTLRPTWANTFVLGLLCCVGIFTQYGLALLLLSLNILIAPSFFTNESSTDIGAHRRRMMLKWAMIQIASLVAVVLVYALALKAQFSSAGFAGEGYLRDAYWNGTFVGLIRLITVNTYSYFRFAYSETGITVFLLGIGCLFSLRDCLKSVNIERDDGS